jgi:general nucleoside transport system permease protein
MELVIVGAIFSTVSAAALIVIAGLGELMAERTGVMNIGIEGVMAIGAVTGVLTVNQWVPNVWLGMLAAALVGLLFGVIFAFTCVKLKANQLLAGLALSFLGDGLSRQIGNSIAGQPALARFEAVRLPLLGSIPVLGDALFNHNIMVYLAFALPIAAYVILFRTHHGVAIRAVGQNPAAADTSGVQVDRLRFVYSALAGLLFGVAGGYLGLALTRGWTEGVVAGRGWIALTLVYFSRWNPVVLLLGALLFGGITSLSFILQIQDWGINSQFLGMLPYVVTLLLILISSILRKRAQRQLGIGPAALAQPYYRE